MAVDSPNLPLQLQHYIFVRHVVTKVLIAFL